MRLVGAEVGTGDASLIGSSGSKSPGFGAGAVYIGVGGREAGLFTGAAKGMGGKEAGLGTAASEGATEAVVGAGGSFRMTLR